jgi:hypothetical protein
LSCFPLNIKLDEKKLEDKDRTKKIMKTTILLKTTLIISTIIITLSLSIYSQDCTPKTINFGENVTSTVTLKGITKPCSSFVFNYPSGSRLRVELASNPFVSFAMVRANGFETDSVTKKPKATSWGHSFCKECNTFDGYLDVGGTNKIWVYGDEESGDRAFNYRLTLTLTATPIVSGGIINNKAISLPKPIYPKEANNGESVSAPKNTKPQNTTVTVKVLLHENGRVYFALAVSGDKRFYLSAEQAAMTAKFKPTLVNGKAVRVDGLIVYNFKSN